MILQFSGRADDAARVAERALEVAGQIGDPWQAASSRGLLALCLADGSTPVDQAIARCEALLERTDAEAEVMPKGKGALAVMYAEAGRFDEGRAIIDAEFARARAAGAAWHIGMLFVSAIRIELAAGAYDRAASHSRSACSLLEVEDDRHVLPAARAATACILVRLGAVDEARKLARLAHATAASPDDFYEQVAWRTALALVDAHDGRIEAALQLSSEALTRVNGSDLLTYRGHRLEDAAIVRRLAGDNAGARQALEDALALYQRKGSVAHAEQVRRQLAEV